ncbi:glycoside hydrolase [Paenibacillus marchantiophytorum]|uniref:Glycoside hydrolase n=1 Tax=Paenibacillus marchantiophytorum TaxID=1619310 RepID=A0ABQ2BS46_9BACL|nr:glycosyltransferase family 4 protein [Paenibacillus marchantiophytorum]GGI46262.1 glycoside hydrolase [Paenibacillus marchantiophytorum]
MNNVIFRFLYRVAVYGKKFLNPILSTNLKKNVKRKLLSKAYPLNELPTKKEKYTNFDEADEIGVNLVGYSRAEMGIGESCRIAAKSLNAENIPFGIINFEGTNSSRMSDTTWQHKEIKSPLYNVNIFHVNAEQMMEIYSSKGNEIFDNRYNIGYWHWELPDFPDEWIENFRFVDEVWVPSNFVLESISMKSPVPVVKIPHSIEVKIQSERTRQYFNLPEDPFLFLCMYDAHSYQERKNPEAAIIAFKMAFLPEDLSVGLVIKVNNSRSTPSEIKHLEEMIQDYRNIYLLKETYVRNDVNALLAVIDCFVSLHRSEGFGLGLAEAMYLGKAVIGTNWSSNIDFMKHDNSCLVDFKLINLGEDHGPYQSYQYWADPDVNHAAFYMRKLAEDKDFYDVIAQNGEKTIKEQFSPQAIGTLIRKRLKYIG